MQRILKDRKDQDEGEGRVERVPIWECEEAEDFGRVGHSRKLETEAEHQAGEQVGESLDKARNNPVRLELGTHVAAQG
jgi:hypothetical protein